MRSIVLMAQKVFKIAHACELYVPAAAPSPLHPINNYEASSFEAITLILGTIRGTN
jgi:hypothetical protein